MTGMRKGQCRKEGVNKNADEIFIEHLVSFFRLSACLPRFKIKKKTSWLFALSLITFDLGVSKFQETYYEISICSTSYSSSTVYNINNVNTVSCEIRTWEQYFLHIYLNFACSIVPEHCTLNSREILRFKYSRSQRGT